MYIAHPELLYFWILCLLANFDSSADCVTSRSARRLVQNVQLAHTLSGYHTCVYLLDTLDLLKLPPEWYTGVNYLKSVTMSSVKNITASSRRHADKPKARGCGHWINGFDVHNYCPICRENNTPRGKYPPDPCMTGEPCAVCETFSADQLDKISTRRKYVRKSRDPHRPDLSAELDTGSEPDIQISAAQEATLLEMSQEQVEDNQNPVDQSFQGKEPPAVHNPSHLHTCCYCYTSHPLEGRPSTGHG